MPPSTGRHLPWLLIMACSMRDRHLADKTASQLLLRRSACLPQRLDEPVQPTVLRVVSLQCENSRGGSIPVVQLFSSLLNTATQAHKHSARAPTAPSLLPPPLFREPTYPHTMSTSDVSSSSSGALSE